MYLRRAGRQSLFSPLLNVQGGADSQVEATLEYRLANLHIMAERMHMSPRNLGAPVHRGNRYVTDGVSC
ncbi:hypothetical protein AB7M29_004105 [Pseudomonas sp. F-14 TE3623]